MAENPGKRAAAREEMMRQIVAIGRAQLVRDGAGALSLREVAREIGVVSSAVYRYVASRDELLTLLVVDGYNDFGDAVESGDGAAATLPANRRYIEVAARMRAWAVSNPERWTLLYGTPVRGYSAPPEQTTQPGTRVLAVFMDIAASAPGGEVDAEVDEELDRFFTAEQEQFGTELPAGTMVRAATLWSGTVGAITAELFGQWGPMGQTTAEKFFAAQVRALSTGLMNG